jgi:hypothetical protein
VVSGQWSVVSGQWSVVGGQWSAGGFGRARQLVGFRGEIEFVHNALWRFPRVSWGSAGAVWREGLYSPRIRSFIAAVFTGVALWRYEIVHGEDKERRGLACKVIPFIMGDRRTTATAICGWRGKDDGLYSEHLYTIRSTSCQAQNLAVEKVLS